MAQAQAITSAPRGMDYRRARLLLLGGGTLVLLVIAGVMYVRRVETVEVLATLLFIPVFVGVVLWGIRGGLATAVLAALGYAALRYPAIDAVGAGRFLGLLVSRALAYVAFGAIGGWASQQLEASLSKLELYDQIDDATGLYNARFFIQDTDLEISRSQRYQTIFSVAVVHVTDELLSGLGRNASKAVKELGHLLGESVRTVDRAVHTRDQTTHLFAVVLPETGPEGARIFTDRLAERIRERLTSRGGTVSPSGIGRVALTFPDDAEALQRLREEFVAIDRAEHPEAYEAAAT